MARTDWQLLLLDGLYDFTGLCEWGVNIEETLGRPATATWVMQDRDDPPGFGPFASMDPGGIGFNLEELDVQARIIGRDDLVFRGKILAPSFDLPEGFPWRRWECQAVDYQRTLYDRRRVGVPDGFNWSGPDTDGNYTPVDPRPWLGNGLFLDSGAAGADAAIVAGILADPLIAGASVIDATTFVQGYLAAGALTNDPIPVDRTTPRAVLEALAARVGGNLQYWLDPGLASTGQWRQHWAVIPRWFEQETPDYFLALGLPSTSVPLEQAPADIDNDAPDGITTIGCRKIRFAPDYSNGGQQYWVNGGLGYAYNGGVVKTNGTGWVSFGTPDSLPSGGADQDILDAPESIDARTKVAAATRAGNAVAQGIMRGSLIVGNERHHPDGWHVGQTFGLKDRRLPGYLNNRRWVIQKVNTTLIPGNNIRVYVLEFGDAPIARSSSRHAPAATAQKPPLPGRLWDIAYRQFTPLPGSTTTVVGQLINDANEPRRVPGVTVALEVLTWDATDTPVIPTEGTLSADTAVSDVMGQWSVDMTAGSGQGYSYKVQPKGATP